MDLLAIQLKVLEIRERIKHVAVFAAWPVLVLGVLGNVVALVVFLKKTFKKTSCGIYFAAVIIVDLLFILLGVVPDLLLISLEEDMDDWVGVGLCKFWTFASRTLRGLSGWLLLATAVDTFLLLQNPKRTLEEYFVTKAVTVIVCFALFEVALNLWVFWGVGALGRVAVTGTFALDHCGYSNMNFLKFDTEENYFVILIFNSILPAFGLILLNVPIVTNFAGSETGGGQEQGIGSVGKKSRILVLSSSLTFLLMEAPNIAMGALFWPQVLVPYQLDPVGLSWRLFAKAVLIFFGHLHHSLKFYMFCGVSATFRNDVRTIHKSNETLVREIVDKNGKNGGEGGQGMAKF